MSPGSGAAANASVSSPLSLGEVTLPTGTDDQVLEGSNGQRAIESAMAAKQEADSALRMVLASDGNLDGEVMAARGRVLQGSGRGAPPIM